jgi:Arylsulfotransferase (ASST)
MMVDNWGGQPYKNASRILEIDPVTQQVVWRYSGGEEEEFFSEIRGKEQVLPTGNVLITEPQEGRVLEVTRDATLEIVWEYYNRIPPKDGERRVGLVTLALRIRPEEASFLNWGS